MKPHNELIKENKELTTQVEILKKELKAIENLSWSQKEVFKFGFDNLNALKRFLTMTGNLFHDKEVPREFLMCFKEVASLELNIRQLQSKNRDIHEIIEKGH